MIFFLGENPVRGESTAFFILDGSSIKQIQEYWLNEFNEFLDRFQFSFFLR